MHRDHVIRCNLLQGGDDLANIILLEGSEMEAADDGVNLVDAGRGFGLLDDIDDAPVAAGGENDQTASFQMIGCRNLMTKLIGGSRLSPVRLR